MIVDDDLSYCTMEIIAISLKEQLKDCGFVIYGEVDGTVYIEDPDTEVRWAV